MRVETVATSPEPIIASNLQDTQKNGWTCVNWYNTVFEIAARKTSRIFGHVVAGFVSAFTFIPSLTVDLTRAVINLYDRKISRPETPVQNQVPSCDLSTSSTIRLSEQLPSSETDQQPLADSQQYPLQSTLTKDAENNGVPQTSQQSPPVLSEEQRLTAFIKWLNDKAGKHELLVDKSARKIQRVGRSYLRRRRRFFAFIKWLNGKTGEHGLLIDKSARIIQGVGRSYLRRKGALSTAALAEYKLLCNLNSVEAMPRAQAGFTRVALPEAYPEIVLKASLNRSKYRFIQMRLMRKELKKLGCSHLIVPIAIPVKQFLIEERLPISIDSFDNMRLYCLQPGLFDEAVRELVRLATVCDITADLLDGRIHPLRTSSGVTDFVRYDNLPLYKVTIDGVEQGRLGLIDLEHMRRTQDGKTLRSITRIFPYHYDIIKEEADRLGIQYDDEILKATVANGEKYLAASYQDHYKWLQEKGELDNFKGWSLGISQERMNDVKKAVAKGLISMNEGEILEQRAGFTVRSLEGFLKDGATSAEILSDGITKTVIKNLTRAINENFRQNAQGKTPAQLAKSNLVKLRSLFAKNIIITDDVFAYFRSSDHFEVSPCDCARLIMTDGQYMIRKLVGAIFDELVNGGEMQSYTKQVDVHDGRIIAYLIRC